MTTALLTARPERPRRPAPELVDRALATKLVQLRDLADARITNDGDLIIATVNNVEFIVVPDDNPDGEGRTGALLHKHPTNRRIGRMHYFTPRRVRASDPWTVEDFAWAAGKMTPPAGPTAVHTDLGGWGQWLRTGAHNGAAPQGTWHTPVAAFALWQAIAKRRFGGDLHTAARESGTAALCRRMVLESRWLADSEAAKLS